MCRIHHGTSAVVAVNDGRFLEWIKTLYDIESWTESEIRTKTDAQPCSTRTLSMDIANKQAKNVVVNKPASGSCKSSGTEEQTFNLVTGFQANADAARKAK